MDPIRATAVLPVPVPYREPLFTALADDPGLDFRVIYQSSRQTSWDVADGWFVADHGYPAEHLRSWQLARPGRTPVVWPRGLERALLRGRPEVLIASEFGPTALRALAYARARRIAHLVLTECTPEIDRLLSPAQLWLHRTVARRADGVIAVSSAARERLLRFGVAPERITVALQAADLAAIRLAAASPRAANGLPLRVLTVGRLVPDKNLGRLIEALHRWGDGADLQIIGTGFLEPELRELAGRLGVRVIFSGHLDGERVAAAYAAADLFALVSTYEPFGVAVREAAAAGLPIVCSRAAGAAGDVAVEGRNALLVDPGDTDQIGRALRRLITDPGLRRSLADASRALDAELDGQELGAFKRAIAAAVSRAAPAAPARASA